MHFLKWLSVDCNFHEFIKDFERYSVPYYPSELYAEIKKKHVFVSNPYFFGFCLNMKKTTTSFFSKKQFFLANFRNFYICDASGYENTSSSNSTQIGLSALRPHPSQQYAGRQWTLRLRPPHPIFRPLTFLQDGEGSFHTLWRMVFQIKLV